MRVLGIDPGSLSTGYGIVDGDGKRGFIHICHGRIACERKAPLEGRLKKIFDGLKEIITLHSPAVMAIEKVFVARNASSALKLGHIRGVAMLCAAHEGLEVFQYTPMEVKKALTGYGNAHKRQVQFMVQRFLGIPSIADADASDALAVAICHIHSMGVKE